MPAVLTNGLRISLMFQERARISRKRCLKSLGNTCLTVLRMGGNRLGSHRGERSLAGLIIFLAIFIFGQGIALSLDDFLMAVPSKTICSAYLFIGKDQSFFSAESIDLKLVLIPVSVANMAIMAQQIDGMEYSGNGVLMRANGTPVVMVFSETYKPSWFLFSDQSVKQLTELPGKSVSVGVLGSGSHT